MSADKPTYRTQTTLIHEGGLRSQYQETSEAIYLTSGYAYDSAEQAERRFKEEEFGFQYSRFENPNVQMLEKRLAHYEGADAARGTASGMAAVFAALLCQLKMGDHVVAAKALFGSCRYVVEDLLPRYGIPCTLVDGADLGAWEQAVRPQTKVFFLESPTNPTLDLVDIAGVAKIAKKAGARLVVDNVFATPVLQKPLALGADIVVYSATKHIDGQGRCLGGIVLGADDYINNELRPFLRNTGPAMSPFNAWILLKSMETLEMRVHAHCAGAAAVADFLGDHPGIEKVTYPGRKDHPDYAIAQKQMASGGPLVAFALKADKAGTFRFMNALKLITISNNLGDSKSLITHPATTTHYKLGEEKRLEIGITEGTLRLSVGLEDPADLVDDLTQALAQLS